jgi:hypothetical protein
MPKPKERPLLTISISGPEVRPGRIAVPVLLRICQEAQAAINKQAEANEAKRSDKPGTEIVHRECALELIALKRGSTTLDFARANKQDILFPEMAAISIEAASGVATTLLAANRKRGKWIPPDPGVLDALDELGSIFDAGINKVKWIVPRQNGHKRTAADFVPATLRRVRRHKQEFFPLAEGRLPQFGVPAGAETAPLPAQPQQEPVQESFLEGTLEAIEGKVRITPAMGAPSTLSYGADKCENVLEALHKPVRVTVDSKKHKLVDITITDTTALFNTGDFFNSKSIDQLIAEQGIQPIPDISMLSGAIPDEDVDEFVAEIYRDRKR